MKVSYLDFWSGYDKHCNWFNLLLKDAFKDREIEFDSSPEESDIIFFSCFGEEHKKYKDSNAIKIFYIGENVPANFSVADYCLSFDFDDHGGKNFRLPHWYLYVNWWDEPNFPHSKISLDELFYQYDPKEVYSRKEFCSIMIGNPVQNRIHVAQTLNQLNPVHGYGRVFGNPYDGSKVELLRNYRWNICFENSITDGYVTEKLLEAKVAGCIPIYYGPYYVNKDFNEKCFINYYDYRSPQELLEVVAKIEKSEELFLSLASQPLFNTPPNLDSLKQFLQNVIG